MTETKIYLVNLYNNSERIKSLFMNMNICLHNLYTHIHFVPLKISRIIPISQNETVASNK